MVTAPEAKKRSFLIAGSCLVSVLLIGLAYVNSGPTPFWTQRVDAESAHELLVQYAGKDSDGDGLFDWQEALYGTDPNNPHSVNQEVNDADAVAKGLVAPKFASATAVAIDGSSLPGVSAGPTTLTDQFAKDLFGQYFLTRGEEQPSSEEIAAFVEEGVARLAQDYRAPDTFNLGQVKVAGSGTEALLAYQAAAEKIILAVDEGKSGNELNSFSEAVTKNDAKALAEVKKYADDYAAAGRALMKISVPREAAAAHLRLANSLMHVSTSLSDMSALTTDPLRSMLGMATYTPHALAGIAAMAEMNTVVKQAGAIPPAGALGSEFYARTEKASQQK